MKRALFGLVMAAAPAFAHHSFPATYFGDKKITVEGNVVAFFLRNPHSLIQIEAPDESGKWIRWAVEWGGGAQLGLSGVTTKALRAGDHVILVGNPGRSPEDHRLRLIRITRTSDMPFSFHGVSPPGIERD